MYIKVFLLQREIDILKIDIESSEWDSFDDMFQQGDVLPYVKQLVFETHVNTSANITDFIRYQRIIQQIEQFGFRRWKFTYNTVCTYWSQHSGILRSHCGEHNYINTKFSEG